MPCSQAVYCSLFGVFTMASSLKKSLSSEFTGASQLRLLLGLVDQHRFSKQEIQSRLTIQSDSNRNSAKTGNDLNRFHIQVTCMPNAVIFNR